MRNAHPVTSNQELGLPPSKRHRAWSGIVITAGPFIVGYLVVAYVALPIFWMRYTSHHPSLADIPNVTHTAYGVPGDPLNAALIGTENDLKRIMQAARWYPADPLTLRSRLEIATAAVFEHPYFCATPTSSHRRA